MSSLENKIDALMERMEVLIKQTAPLKPSEDPKIRKDPPQWIKNGGESYEGSAFSQTTPDYLNAMASFCDWKAGKDAEKGTEDGNKYAAYARKDAKLAAQWSEYLQRSADVPKRTASVTQPPAEDFAPGTQDEIPF